MKQFRVTAALTLWVETTDEATALLEHLAEEYPTASLTSSVEFIEEGEPPPLPGPTPPDEIVEPPPPLHSN